ncbi:MAG TPA: choice-of-anchor Q domain-containing protein, partial [Thermoanaerobaculia bacterium]|nr:choice-of-anchor Q domain-containing protein [Thermoanaerobaculia bacterium]
HNVTIAGNSAAKRGGGVFAESSAFIGLDQPEFRNSILAGNTATTGDPDCSGSAVTGGYNILGNATGCFGFGPAFNDLVGVNPQLAALADNGGGVSTRALLAGSPALNAGNPAAPGSGGNACAATDARGATRPGGARCDIGAFEQTTQCVNGGASLCLNDGRFRVTAAWRTNQGQSGQGQAVRLTDDSGYFWFFDPANVEVTLKVLDACTLTPRRFWFFASGLTNVEVTLTVTDTVTGQVKTYVNPLNRNFRPIFDTNAFATCQ